MQTLFRNENATLLRTQTILKLFGPSGNISHGQKRPKTEASLRQYIL